jgi:hypothetical protein
MFRVRKSSVMLAMALAAGGTCFQLGACNVFSLASSAISSINPCGTILDCNPQVYQFLTSGIDGPGVQPDLDPFCTYAPFCDATVDPIFGGLVATP